MKFNRIILFILIIIFFAAVYSCGEAPYVPFTELPDADLGNGYFEHLIENLGQYQLIYEFLLNAHLNEHYDIPAGSDDEEHNALLESTYAEWQAEHPDKLQIVKDNVPKLAVMVTRITGRNYILHWETMKNLIDSYVSAVYINSPAPVSPAEQQTDENGEIVPPETTLFPPIDIDYARENISQYVSADFLSKNPQKAVSDYLNGHNIHVTRIVFDDNFSDFEHHIYPFRIEYSYRIYYYAGDAPAEDESKWQTAVVRAVYFLSINENRDYVISYISRP
jgi:hypothetical protein